MANETDEKDVNSTLKALPYQNNRNKKGKKIPSIEGQGNYLLMLHSEGHEILLESTNKEFAEKLETGERFFESSKGRPGDQPWKVTLPMEFNGKTVPVALTKVVYFASSFLSRQIHRDQEITLDRLKVQFSLADYAKVNGVPVDPNPAKKAEGTDAWEKEKERAKNCRKTFKTRLKKILENLPHITLEFTRPKGKPGAGDFRIAAIASDVAIERGYVKITFGEVWAAAMRDRPINYAHPAIFRIENKDENAFKIGALMNFYYMISRNRERGTNNRLKVATLLQHSNLPRIDSNAVKSDGWNARIKEPLEKVLDRLANYGLLKSWGYVRSGGEPMTDKEAYELSQDKSKWLEALVQYELTTPAPILPPSEEE